ETRYRGAQANGDMGGGNGGGAHAEMVRQILVIGGCHSLRPDLCLVATAALASVATPAAPVSTPPWPFKNPRCSMPCVVSSIRKRAAISSPPSSCATCGSKAARWPAMSTVDALRRRLIDAARSVQGVENVSVNISSKIVAHAVQRGVQLLPNVK